MLDFLITSDARRGLLTLLWVDGASGTVATLARRASISTAAAHRELRAMCRVGIARELRIAGRRTYEAAVDSPHAQTLTALARLPTGEAATGAPSPDLDRNRIKNALAAYGAPLKGHRVSTKTDMPLEQALALGCRLAHDDPAVALAMPQLLFSHYKRLDTEAFETALHEAGEKHTAGFLLALTAKLTRTPTLARLAETLRDGRRKRLVHFFSPLGTPRPARDNYTLPIAREWLFHFPLPMANFKIKTKR